MPTMKTRVGHLGGSDSSPQLPVTVWMDDYSPLVYLDAMNEALAAVPSSIFGVPIGGVTNIDEISAAIIVFTITYKSTSITYASPPAEPAIGTAVRRFPGVQTKAQKRKEFITAGRVFQYNSGTEVTDDVSADYPYAKWQINAHIVPGVGFPPQESTFEPYAESWGVDYIVDNDDVDYAYIQAVREAAALGVFNSVTFDGKEQGTVQLVRFSAMPKDVASWEYSFGFADVPALEDVNVGGDIVVPFILGSEYHWVREYKVYDDSGGVLESTADIAIVGQVWPEEDLATLLDLPTLP